MADKTNVDELAAYDDDEEAVALTDVSKSVEKDTHIALHASGFKDLMLKPELLRAVADCGFEHPSEVQYEGIPAAIGGTDLVCQAKSGMGKTAVFVLSGLQQLDTTDNNYVSILVLAHVRELAFQIQQEFNRFIKFLPGVRTKVVYGGTPLPQDVKDLQALKPQILIGTPGRVHHLIKDGHLDLSHLKHFILDECDQMLEKLDMRRTVQEIFQKTPHNKQVMMFSATLSPEVRAVCKRFMHNPREIYINDGAKLTLHGLQQYYVNLTEKEKNRKLVGLLDDLDFNQVVIFVKNPERAKALSKLLNDEGFPAVCSYGNMEQEKRIEKYSSFKNFSTRIMVSTNMYGRGVDFERVNVVINYDMPEHEDTYLHRVGRAGRFGTKGLAISFVCTEEDQKVLDNVQSKFHSNMSVLPDKIDPSTYMTA